MASIRKRRIGAAIHAATEALERRVLLAAYTVTSNADSGPGTLREAIGLANASAVDDTITVNATSVSLTSGQLTLQAGSGTTTIIGATGSEAIYCNYTSRFLKVEAGASASVNRVRLALGAANGATGDNGYGGLFLNYGTLSISDCWMQDSQSLMRGAAIYSGAGSTLTVSNSTINSNGTQSSDSGAKGGGVYVEDANATLTNCTIAFNNTAGFAGGIYVLRGHASLVHCTIYANHANGSSGGIRSDNGGGGNPAPTTMHNSIVAGNSIPPTGLDSDVVGSFDTASSYNLMGVVGANFTEGVNNNHGGTLSSPMSMKLAAIGLYGGYTRTIPLLPGSPAIDAGGGAGMPSTDQRGIARTFGSARDVGAFESRGFSAQITSGDNQSAQPYSYYAQPVTVQATSADGVSLTGTAVSISGFSTNPTTLDASGSATFYVISAATPGNYLAPVLVGGTTMATAHLTVNPGAPAPLVVNTSGDNEYPVGGNFSLRIAVSLAAARPGDDTITFDPAVFNSATPGSVNLTSELLINDTSAQTIIQGPSAKWVNLRSMTASQRVLSIAAGAVATVSGVTISNGTAVSGAGVRNLGTLTLDGCWVTNNNRSGSFGGIYSSGGSLTVRNSTISGNSGGSNGGVYVSSGTATFLNSTVSGNTASFNPGGGIFINSGTALLVNCTIASNAGNSGGGGVHRGSGTVTLHNCIVANNTGAAGDPDIGGTIDSSSSNNLVRTLGAGHGISNGVNGNIAGVDPQLGPLNDYGGPTLTHTIYAASPAVNAGSNAQATAAGLTTDQRGFNRFVGTVDIGAVEFFNNNATLPQIVEAGMLFAPSANSLRMEFNEPMTLSAVLTNLGTSATLPTTTSFDQATFTATIAAGTLADGRYRATVNATDYSGNAVSPYVVEFYVLNGTSGDDTLRVKRVGSSVELRRITNASTTTLTTSIAGLQTIIVHGDSGKDSLSLDLSGGDVFTVEPLYFDGGADADSAGVIGPSVSSAFNVSTTQIDGAGHTVLLGESETIQVATGTFSLGENLNGKGLTVGINSKVIANQWQRVSSLTVASTGQLDLRNNGMIVDYAPAAASPIGSWNGSAYTGITGSIASGRNEGTWDGFGIITSLSSVGDSTTRALAIAEASELLGLSGSATTMWNDQSVDASSVLIKYTYAGDLDLNGQLDGDDYFAIDSHVLQSGSIFGYAVGDIDMNGEINGDDYFWIDSQILSQGPPL